MSIGLNRHHLYSSYGSGLCSAYCQILQNSFASQSEGSGGTGGQGAGGNTGGTGGSGVGEIEGNDPEGTSAPSPKDLANL
ncbi:hypothetical protein EB796_007832 [Bugula neritina]|uniref:Uncharacterized protein n=1 Tax=Bugula neritina TaxID=10212 RepID=A0A7J7K6I3_BUGNE|nr:hypothetical protein EB796_007832 [Bugula neritina]